MKIIVFGGKGFIGAALVRALKKKHRVVTMDLKREDVRKPKTFTEKFHKIHADVVVNLAAILGTMTYSPVVKELFETNTVGNLRVLTAAYNAGVRNYVFTSSMTVHGGNNIGMHHTRFSPFAPKQIYSVSKVAAEFSMMCFAREHPDIHIATVRPTMVLGEGTYLPHAPIEFTKTIFSGRDIEIYGDGLHEREWIWIDDVVEGIIKAIAYNASAKPGYQPFFLSSARISMKTLAEKITKRIGGRVLYIPATRQTFTLTADSRESQHLLGWKPKYNMNAMIDNIIAIYKLQKSK